MVIVYYESRLNQGLCIIDLHCIYKRLVIPNGALLGSNGLSDQVVLSDRAPFLCRVSSDHNGLLCQIQVYSCINFNGSNATQNSRLMQKHASTRIKNTLQSMRLKYMNQLLNVETSSDGHHWENDKGANTVQLCDHVSYESWSRSAASFTRTIPTVFFLNYPPSKKKAVL